MLTHIDDTRELPRVSSPMTHSDEFFALFSRLTEHSSESRVDAASSLSVRVAGNSEELQYSVKRLVRGLGSSRAAARQGFALALCTLLRERDVRLEKQTTPTNKCCDN